MFDSYRKRRQTAEEGAQAAFEAVQLAFGESKLRQWNSFIDNQRQILQSILKGWHWWNRRTKRECVRNPHIRGMGNQLRMVATTLKERDVPPDEVTQIRNGIELLLADICQHCRQLEEVDKLPPDAELLQGIATLLTTLREKEVALLSSTNRESE